MEPSEMVKDIIKARTGEEPQIHEPTCVLWKADHENCTGCPSNLPCARMTAILLATLKEMMYEPKDFEDFIKTLGITSSTIDRILEAKTVEEIHSMQ